MINSKIILVGILLIASILRFWNLGTNPPHLTPDEAALGYNAYSILKTGHDEYGSVMPVVFRSFGDWKPGLYIYASVPTIAVFGLNEVGVRLPSAIAGVTAVLLLFLVVKELLGNQSSKIKDKLPIIAAVMLAISPWHIHFSRGAWEINLCLTLTLLGVYLFLKGMRDKPIWLVVSAISFALTLWTYQGAKLSSGIVLALLIICFWKSFIKVTRRMIFVSGVLGLLISFPIILSVIQGHAGRLEVYSVFSYPRPAEVVDAISNQGNEPVSELSFQVFHNEPLNFARGILGRWFNHFSGRFLFFEGDWSNPRHSPGYVGVILLADAVLLIAGIYAAAKDKISSQTLFILLWLIAAPLPAVLSRDSVHAVRAYNMLIPLTIILAMGANQMFRVMRQVSWKVIIGVFAILYIGNFVYFLDQYFIHQPVHQAKYWQYGYRQMVQEVNDLKANYKEVVIAQSYDQPYIYFLFYNKYDPMEYQKKAQLSLGIGGAQDVGLVTQLDNITFQVVDWPRDRGRVGTLFVGTEVQIPPGDSNDPEQFKKIREIYFPKTDNVAFRMIQIGEQ